MSGGWRVLAVSVPGDSHLRVGRPCEDSHRWAPVGERGLALAVADGLSSASHAATGAAVAADAALAAALSGADGDCDRSPVARSARIDRIVNTARDRTRAALAVIDPAGEPGAGASTLGICMVTPLWIAFGVVGDVFLLVHRADATWHVAGSPRSGGDAVNVTTTLLDRPASPHEQVLINDPGIDAVAICTDGLVPLLLDAPGTPDERVNVAFADPLLRHLIGGEDPNLAASLLLSRADVRARTENDCTLVLAAKS